MAYSTNVQQNVDTGGPFPSDQRQGIIKMLEEGIALATALDFFGIHPGIFRAWMSVGATEPDTPQGQFYIAARRAAATFEVEVTRGLAAALKPGVKGAGQLALEVLSRRNNSHWGKREDKRTVPPEELDALIEHEFTRLAANSAAPALPAGEPVAGGFDVTPTGGLAVPGLGGEDGVAEQATPDQSFARHRTKVRTKRRA